MNRRNETSKTTSTVGRRTRVAVTAAILLAPWLAVAVGPARAVEPDIQESAGLDLNRREAERSTEAAPKSYQSPLTLSAAAFRSDGYNPDELRHLTLYDQIQGQDNENAYAVAPVYLPHGATITSVGVGAFDGVGSTGACSHAAQRDVSVYLLRVDNYTGTLRQMSFQATTGQSADPQYLLDTEVEYNVVDYPTYSYYAVVKLCHSAQTLFTMQIYYTLP
jgi:hypothetical protein